MLRGEGGARCLLVEVGLFHDVRLAAVGEGGVDETGADRVHADVLQLLAEGAAQSQ